MRPIGITALEDKVVQRAVREVLNAIYEADFLGFSYGFRTGRGQHDALGAVTVGIERRRIRWVLEDGAWREEKEGVPRGGSISPLLANIYLHYALDLWVKWWRKHRARGEVIIVRYADDFVVGFEHKTDADRFHEALRERLNKFNLELSEEKTRLIEFGCFACRNRKERGEGKPETFNFPGFTHIRGTTRKGRFCVLRKTMTKKVRAKLKSLKDELRKRIHRSTAGVGAWLRAVVTGHYRYRGVPRNYRSMHAFRNEVIGLWRRALRRRGHKKGKVTWERMKRLADRWLPKPRIVHPYPTPRLTVNTRGRSPVR